MVSKDYYRENGRLRNEAGETEDTEVYTIDSSPLEYRPILERDVRERTAWDKDSFSKKPYQDSNKYYDIGDGVVTDLIKDYNDFRQELANKMEDTINQYGNVIIDLPDYTLEDVNDALKALGLSQPIKFKDYAAMLDKRNTPAGDFLVELIEKQLEGIDGNINMEIFHDYYELDKEIAVTQEYLHRQALSSLFDSIDFNKSNWEEELLKQELEWKSKKEQVEEQRLTREELIKDAFLFNQSNYQYQKMLKAKEEPDYKKKQLEYSQLTDTMTISKFKLKDSKQLFDYMENVETIANKEKINKSISDVIHYAVEDAKTKDNLTQFEQMLIVSTESKNNEKTHYKNTLRNVYNEEFLQHNLDELSVYNDLYQHSVIPLTSVIKFYNEPQDDETTAFLETLSSSMIQTRNEQKSKTKDFDNLNIATYNLRMKKIKETEDKEKTRQTYHIIDKILEDLE